MILVILTNANSRFTITFEDEAAKTFDLATFINQVKLGGGVMAPNMYIPGNNIQAIFLEGYEDTKPQWSSNIDLTGKAN